MYEAYYHFQKAPFTNIPDPDFLYLTPQHKRATSILEYALATRAGFCVITGDVGAGKTTLLRSVLRRVDPNIEIGLVSNTQCDSFEEFLSWVLLAFDLQPKGKGKVELYDEFVQFLIEQHSQGHPVTLIVDEAQHLGYKYLEQLRMLSNVNTERGQLLQTILVGQPELWELLNSPELEQFSQRISYDYYLEPLQNTEQVASYVKHRLTEVGGNPELFREETFESIYNATGGVPRLINLLCDNALLYGYAEEKNHIDEELIQLVVVDKAKSFSPIGKKQRAAKPNPITPTEEEPESTTNIQTVLPTSMSHSNPINNSKASTERSSMSTIERAARKLKDA